MISTITALILLIDGRKKNAITVVAFCLIIPATSYLYISYFDFLGLVDYTNASQSKENSIKNKVFINDLKFPDNLIISKNDSLKIISGWSEKRIIINHKHLIKRYDDSSMVNYIIKLKGNKSLDSLGMNYNIDDTSINGSSSIDSIINFSLPKSTQQIVLTFFNMTDRISNDTIIKKVIIPTK